jgi:hypothetical protein
METEEHRGSHLVSFLSRVSLPGLDWSFLPGVKINKGSALTVPGSQEGLYE